MKVNIDWLKEKLLSLPQKAQHIADVLTMAGLEVESVAPVAPPFQGVVVAEVKETSPHPQADRLTLCQVDAGSAGVWSVVCGASNVRAGLKVALALTGAVLPGNFIIKETTLRGALSQGMLCSVEELGLSDKSDGILELDADAPIGMDFRKYWDLEDTVLDINMTPNRAECLSVLGVARELSTLLNIPLSNATVEAVPAAITDTLPITIQDPKACAYYLGRVLRNINPHALTPLWMRERLRRAGLRVVHPVVDILNYVMWELGQPLHAFDLTKIQGALEVRWSHAGETLSLLNGQNISCEQPTLCIADSQGLLALAGVMGGAESAVTEHTTDIFIECAYFDAIALAGVARRYGLSSDAAQRFERGVDITSLPTVMERVSTLLLEIVGGEIGPVSVQKGTMPEPVPDIVFDPQSVARYVGFEIPQARMQEILTALGCVVREDAACWKVSVPAHRVDLRLAVDLIEEIIRVYGYEHIPYTPFKAVLSPMPVNQRHAASRKAMQILQSKAYQEVINYSFVDPELQTLLHPDREMLRLLNPISSELSVMRVSLWPGLIAAMMRNIHRQHQVLRLCENGVVFHGAGSQVEEIPMIAGLLTGSPGALHWAEPDKPFDFFDMKGDVERVLSAFSKESFSFVPAEHPALHPGMCARIQKGSEFVGYCGALHPNIIEALDLSQEVYLFECALAPLSLPVKPQYMPVAKFPYNRRDLSFLVDERVLASDIETTVRSSAAGEWIKAFYVFDVYQGASIPAGKKSLAIAVILQDDKKTMVDAEIHGHMDCIVQALQEKFQILLRD
ncbi:MAG: phenylalanine--tRNA ligase subunit beta [Legionellaceae bacterium]|nr:phenylalanine--tRNA ligase subunit beta [Legionellaceae bacterium]